jgi:formylmethanofuran:tetrahydromethanopterin formyltransferase
MAEKKKEEYTFKKDIKSGTLNAPDTDSFDANYDHEQDMEKIKKLEVCDLGPDAEGICEPEEKKPEHIFVSEDKKKKE